MLSNVFALAEEISTISNSSGKTIIAVKVRSEIKRKNIDNPFAY